MENGNTIISSTCEKIKPSISHEIEIEDKRFKGDYRILTLKGVFVTDPEAHYAPVFTTVHKLNSRLDFFKGLMRLVN